MSSHKQNSDYNILHSTSPFPRMWERSEGGLADLTRVLSCRPSLLHAATLPIGQGSKVSNNASDVGLLEGLPESKREPVRNAVAVELSFESFPLGNRAGKSIGPSMKSSSMLAVTQTKANSNCSKAADRFGGGLGMAQ